MKPHFKYQLNKWNLSFPTEHGWSWFIGSGTTLNQAWDMYIQALLIANMMKHNHKYIC